MLNKHAYQHTYYAQHIFDIVTVSISNMYVCADSRIKSNKKTCIAYLHILFGFLNLAKPSPWSVSSINFLDGSFTNSKSSPPTCQTHQSPPPFSTRVFSCKSHLKPPEHTSNEDNLSATDKIQPDHLEVPSLHNTRRLIGRQMTTRIIPVIFSIGSMGLVYFPTWKVDFCMVSL